MSTDEIIVKAPFSEVHRCDNLFILCSDFRFHQGVAKLERSLGIKLADVIRIPGGIKCLFDKGSNVQKTMLFWIKLLCEKHEIKCIYLVAHLECAAYKVDGISFSDPAMDQEFHMKELAKAVEVIKKLVPTVIIKPFIARISQNRKRVEFVSIE